MSGVALDIETLWPYMGGHKNAGAGNWWGMSLGVTKRGTVLAGGLLKLDVAIHAEPTVLDFKRSEDGGRTFGPSSVIVGDPTNSTEYGGGVFLYSSHSDTVFFLYLDMKSNPSKSLVYVLRSHDDGVTWSGPVVASNGTANASAGEVVGHGIELQNGPHAGRLIVPVTLFFGNTPSAPGFDLRVWALYSDDDGKTWESGDFMPAPHQQLESTVAELKNGSLVMTARNGQARSASDLCEHGQKCRTFARSDDGGASWSEQWYPNVEELPVHRCQAAMIGAADGTLYFGSPMNMTTGDRTNYTIYASDDGGRHWHWAAGVFGGSSGYSDMLLLPSGELAVAFQRGLDLPHKVGGGYEYAYARVNLTQQWVSSESFSIV